MGRDPLEVDLMIKKKSLQYLKDVCIWAIPHVMRDGQVLEGTSTVPKKSRYCVAVEATQCSSLPQELQLARNEIPSKGPIFSLGFNFLVPKTNTYVTARTVTTTFTAVPVHMNSALGDIINSFKS
ncbi:hypothetical protein TNCV_1782361 [Trichonephila clavipes]|nr:hypothetical protein TNCV_1782361 [Trichonephila clavipes]